MGMGRSCTADSARSSPNLAPNHHALLAVSPQSSAHLLWTLFCIWLAFILSTVPRDFNEQFHEDLDFYWRRIVAPLRRRGGEDVPSPGLRSMLSRVPWN